MSEPTGSKYLLPLIEQVFEMAESREIYGEKVANEERLFSIYELHTDIIVKGSRDVKFEHKINPSTGRPACRQEQFDFKCETLEDNPSDSTLYRQTLDKVIADYGVIPRDSVMDGGYASKENMDYAREKRIVNVVFNKIVGCLKNITSSMAMETRLKKWRSSIEASISKP